MMFISIPIRPVKPKISHVKIYFQHDRGCSIPIGLPIEQVQRKNLNYRAQTFVFDRKLKH